MARSIKDIRRIEFKYGEILWRGELEPSAELIKCFEEMAEKAAEMLGEELVINAIPEV
jgi:hypothetical protein